MKGVTVLYLECSTPLLTSTPTARLTPNLTPMETPLMGTWLYTFRQIVMS